MGQTAYQRALDNQTRQEELAMKKAGEARAAELHGLQTRALGRKESQDTQLAGLRRDMVDVVGGVNRQATDSNLDADFAQAEQATAMGLQPPPMLGGSNAANEKALTVSTPVNHADRGYQSRVAGLRQQYALTSGDMADFDRVQAADKARVQSIEDSVWALKVIENPAGSEAVQARSFINDSSKTLSIDPPDKTGMSTMRIIKGDRTTPVSVSPSDLGKVSVGVRRLMRGDVGGLDVIASVNKDLAAAAAAELGIDIKLADFNNKVASDRADLQVKQQDIATRAAYYGGARQGSKQLPPEMVSRLNDLSVQIAETADPNERARLEAQWSRENAIAATYLGRVIQPRGEAQVKPGEGLKKVDEPGTVFADERGRVYTADGRGNRIVEGGVAPAEFAAALKKAGVPEYAWGQIQLSPDGAYFGYRGMAYDVSELPLVAEKVTAHSNMLRQRTEASKSRMNPPAVRGGPVDGAPEPAYGPPVGINRPPRDWHGGALAR